MQQLLDLPQTWTFDDLQQLPEELDWRRYEIVDGALVVSPSADVDHEFVGEQLRAALRGELPVDLWFGGPLTVDLDPSYRIPDLVVIPRSLVGHRRKLLQPAEIRLAIEIVSPSSRTTDRVTKPAQYASAGIREYWRVEIDPEVSLTAYTLSPGAETYTELGTWRSGERAHLDQPFPVSIDIGALTPRP